MKLSGVLLSATFATVLLGIPTSAAAQDDRWTPWLGCWERVSDDVIEGAAGDPGNRVAPAKGPTVIKNPLVRSGLTLAGTESLLMSLWPVSDLVTRELMVSYYENLRAGAGRGAALRQVQLSMLKRPSRRHPFYWASFIHSGEWANLEGKR